MIRHTNSNLNGAVEHMIQPETDTEIIFNEDDDGTVHGFAVKDIIPPTNKTLICLIQQTSLKPFALFDKYTAKTSHTKLNADLNKSILMPFFKGVSRFTICDRSWQSIPQPCGSNTKRTIEKPLSLLKGTDTGY